MLLRLSIRMEGKGLDEVLRELEQKRKGLIQISQTLERLANNYSRDTTITRTAQALRSHTSITRDAFTHIENLYRANAMLRQQNEILKNAILSIPQIKQDEQVQKKIERYFNEYRNASC